MSFRKPFAGFDPARPPATVSSEKMADWLVQKMRASLPKDPPGTAHWDFADGRRIDRPFDLSAPVGQGRENRPQDVARVQGVMERLGLFRAGPANPPGRFTRPLGEALTDYQKGRGLTPDGWAGPGGETIASAAREFGHPPPRPPQAPQAPEDTDEAEETQAMRTPPAPPEPEQPIARMNDGPDALPTYEPQPHADAGGLPTRNAINRLPDEREAQEIDPKARIQLLPHYPDRFPENPKDMRVLLADKRQQAPGAPRKTPTRKEWETEPKEQAEYEAAWSKALLRPPAAYVRKDRPVAAHWQAFNEELHRRGLSETMQQVLGDFFMGEGGQTHDRSGTSSAFGGMTNDGFTNAKKRRPEALRNTPRNTDLTPQTTPDAYLGYLDEVMSRAGTDGKSGHVGMLEDLGDRHTASAVANTLFHDGYAGHKQLHEAAKNTINGIDLKLREERGLSIPSGLTGHQSDTWDVIRWIDEQKLGHVFRANLKKEWSRVHGKEEKRNEYLSRLPPDSP